MKRYLGAVVATITLAMLSACGSLETVVDGDSARDGFTVATLFAIEQSDNRATTALEIIEVAQKAKSVLELQGTGLDELIAKTRTRIASSDAALSRKAALMVLLNRADREIRNSIDAGELPADRKVRINKVLDWIIESASMYAG